MTLRRTMQGLQEAVEGVLYAEALAQSGGFLQAADARVKLAGLVALIVAAAMAARLWVIACILALAVLLAAASRIPLARIARAWGGTLGFTGVLAVPALFLTPGAPIGWGVTSQGLHTAGYLVLRAETAVTLATVLVLTTPWAHLLKALRVFRVPVVFVVVLGMTSRYILLLTETAREMFESRESRRVGRLSGAEARRVTLASAGVLLSKTMALSNEVYLAMLARGFRGEVYLFDEFRLRARDWALAAGLAAAVGAAVWAGR